MAAGGGIGWRMGSRQRSPDELEAEKVSEQSLIKCRCQWPQGNRTVPFLLRLAAVSERSWIPGCLNGGRWDLQADRGFASAWRQVRRLLRNALTGPCTEYDNLVKWDAFGKAAGMVRRPVALTSLPYLEGLRIHSLQS